MIFMKPFEITARLRWHLQQFKSFTAKLWLIQAGLLLAAFVCFLVALWERQNGTRLAQQLTALTVDLPNAMRPALVPPLHQDIRTQLPEINRSAEQLQKLFDIAEQTGLKLQEGDYRLRTVNDLQLQQLTISLPLSADYDHLQRFLAAALYQMPNLGLESLQLQREKSEQVELSVKLQFFLYLSSDKRSD